LSLFLTAFRVIIERGDLKGGLPESTYSQKVSVSQEGKNAPSPFQETSVCTRKKLLQHPSIPIPPPLGNIKSYKTQFPT
jgi:hypothetical protein